jgi:hypothetical protein
MADDGGRWRTTKENAPSHRFPVTGRSGMNRDAAFDATRFRLLAGQVTDEYAQRVYGRRNTP